MGSQWEALWPCTVTLRDLTYRGIATAPMGVDGIWKMKITKIEKKIGK